MKKTQLILLSALVLFGVYGFVNSSSENEIKTYGTVLNDNGDEIVVGTGVGNQAPDIVMKNADGKEMKLSDLKGKLVLIDFWASWCGPCRRENPHVVKAYEEYKDKKFVNGKNFTVYSVSLDKSKERWLGAIEKDKMTWDYHVSVLQGWNCPAAKKYGVRGIPSNFLIDGDGIILAVNLRGHKLMDELAKHLKKKGK